MYHASLSDSLKAFNSRFTPHRLS